MGSRGREVAVIPLPSRISIANKEKESDKPKGGQPNPAKRCRPIEDLEGHKVSDSRLKGRS